MWTQWKCFEGFSFWCRESRILAPIHVIQLIESSLKNKLKILIQQTLVELVSSEKISIDSIPEVQIDRTRDRSHGDFACNVAMVMAKAVKMNPRELAQLIVGALPEADFLDQADIAGPGFINFFVKDQNRYSIVGDIIERGATYGRSDIGQGQRIQVEFVSANPTGPLHVGHGRGAAYGAAVADLLEAVGYAVTREYYVNDAGRQMDILATSVWLRALQISGEDVGFPVNGYRGDYIMDIAQAVVDGAKVVLNQASVDVLRDLPLDEQADGSGDKEAYIDALIGRAKALLGSNQYQTLHRFALMSILDEIRDDLSEFGIDYQCWFHESGLVKEGKVEASIALLTAQDRLYQQDGAWWFRSTEFGDEKDRVVVRDNGETTYFAADIAYHLEKFERGFDRVINVWGADHHGYIPRVKASLEAMGSDPEKLEVQLVQFANLFRGGEKIQMSTRSGQFVTLRELREEVGNDAARFFYILRKSEQHLDFDLDLAKSKSNENPVFYVQYAHARICSVFNQLEDKNMPYDQQLGLNSLSLLSADEEQGLIVLLAKFGDVVQSAALHREPHQLAYYLRDLATQFHAYYNAHQFLVDGEPLRQARLVLIVATRQLIANGLGLLGVSAPEAM